MRPERIARYLLAAGLSTVVAAGLCVQPLRASVGLTPAILAAPADGTVFTYGQHFSYCYTIPTSAPDHSNDPYSGLPSTRLDFYVDGNSSTNDPDSTPRGTQQCPLDTYATSPGKHTWWIVLSIETWAITGTSAECLATPPVPSDCYSWVRTGETSTSQKWSYTIEAPPTGPVGVSINDGATYTTTPAVTLRVVWPAGATGIVVSNDGGFANAKTYALKEYTPWTLVSSGDERLPKTVYLRFEGKGDTTYTDDIILDETPPSVTAPTLALTSALGLQFADASGWESLLSAAAHQATITWSGSDSNSGLDRFEVQSSAAGKSWTALTLTSATSTSASATLPNGSYRFRVRAKDKAGNWSGWATSTEFAVTDQPVTPVPSSAAPGETGASASQTDALSSAPTGGSSSDLPTALPERGAPASAQVATLEVVGLAFGSGLLGAALLVGSLWLIRRLRRHGA